MAATACKDMQRTVDEVRRCQALIAATCPPLRGDGGGAIGGGGGAGSGGDGKAAAAYDAAAIAAALAPFPALKARPQLA